MSEIKEGTFKWWDFTATFELNVLFLQTGEISEKRKSHSDDPYTN